VSKERPEPDPVQAALNTAGEAIIRLTGQLEEIWHPGEMAWQLHVLAADEDSLLARLERHLLQTARWCHTEGSTTGLRSAAELAAAAQQLTSIRRAVTGQTGPLTNLVQHLAEPDPAASAAATQSRLPPSPASRRSPRRR
jgi:HAMP domain-containing protein